MILPSDVFRSHAWPWIMRHNANLQTETWTQVKIEVKGRSAKL
jgi:hypothetical protein